MGTDKNYARTGSGGKESTPGPDDNLIYIRVPEMTTADLAKAKRAKITLNEEEISLIYIDGAMGGATRVHATQARCPHAGGPLHLADIEDLPDAVMGGLCIKCPWHSWKFDLATGKCVSPPAGAGKGIKIYPVRVVGLEIRLGFDRIAPGCFNSDQF